MSERRSKAPTHRQLEYLRAIQAFQREHGYSPRLAELSQAVGLSGNKTTVWWAILRLKQKGLLKKVDFPRLPLVLTQVALELLGEE